MILHVKTQITVLYRTVILLKYHLVTYSESARRASAETAAVVSHCFDEKKCEYFSLPARKSTSGARDFTVSKHKVPDFRFVIFLVKT